MHDKLVGINLLLVRWSIIEEEYCKVKVSSVTMICFGPSNCICVNQFVVLYGTLNETTFTE